jgi:hypothetical protein
MHLKDDISPTSPSVRHVEPKTDAADPNEIFDSVSLSGNLW